MPNTLTLNVYTPDRTVCCLEAEMVIARAVDGEIGILPGHAPLVTALDIAPLRVKQTDGEASISVCNGFMEVTDDQVTIIAPCAETSEEIDVHRAMAAKERAEERLRQHTDDIDVQRAEQALRRALNRLKVAEHIRR